MCHSEYNKILQQSRLFPVKAKTLKAIQHQGITLFSHKRIHLLLLFIVYNIVQFNDIRMPESFEKLNFSVNVKSKACFKNLRKSFRQILMENFVVKRISIKKQFAPVKPILQNTS